MIYIKIPKGMEYKAAETVNGSLLDDRLVFTSGQGDDISIQAEVHKFYSTHKDKQETENGLSFYKRRPSGCSSNILQYRAIDNGTKPTDHAVFLNTTPSVSPKYRVGTWINQTFLSPQSAEKAKKKAEDQKLNRRKWGDSPCIN